MIFTRFLTISLLLSQPLLCMENPITTLSCKIVQMSAQQDVKIDQFLQNSNVPGRLKMEIDTLRNNKDFIIDACAVASKTHPFEIKTAFYDDKVGYVVVCKMPQDYPFYAPVFSLETENDQLDEKDLRIIAKDFTNELSQIWSPTKKVHDLITMVNAKIRLYEKRKIAAQELAKGSGGCERTIAHLKEKYESKKVIVGNKYPGFQEKFRGLWVKEVLGGYGYVVFHVEGDYITIAFEPKYAKEASSLYHGYYAVGDCDTDNNKFEIHISDAADSGKTNRFKITFLDSKFISIVFNFLRNDSVLETIMSQLGMGDVILESITLFKV